MEFSSDEVSEFRIEALELLEAAEQDLISLERGGSFSALYDAVFRVFHSLKGGAGMLGLSVLQNYMHALEGRFAGLKGATTLPKSEVSVFLEGVDAARRILGGEDLVFRPPTQTATKHECAKSPVKKDLRPLVYSVDDEPLILEVIKDILEGAEIRCEIFERPADLFAAVKKEPPLLVLTDMKMPLATGLEVLTEIRKGDPDLPVLFVSEYLDKDVLLEGIEAGVFSAIEKPFNEKSVLTAVRNAMRHRELSHALNRTFNLLLYQFSDLDGFLADQGKDDIRRTIRNEMNSLLECRRKLRQA